MTYYRTIASKFLMMDASDLGEMAVMFEAEAADLRQMEKAGVVLDCEIENGYATLVTENQAVAKEFGFEELMGYEDEEAV
jgi:hypothetical protein